MVSALKGTEVSYGDQELGSEDRTHPRQASEDPGLGTGEKTLCELLVEDLEALFEGEHLFGKLGDDRCGDFFGGQDDALRVGRTKGLPRAFFARFSAPLTPRFLRKVARRFWPTRRMAAGVW